MIEYEELRDIVETERDGVCKTLLEHPKRYSEEGKSYWNGNVAALNWVLTKIADLHFSGEKANEN